MSSIQPPNKNSSYLPKILHDSPLDSILLKTFKLFDNAYIYMQEGSWDPRTLLTYCKKNRKIQLCKNPSIIHKIKLECISGLGPKILSDGFKCIPEKIVYYLSITRLNFLERYLENKFNNKTLYREKITNSFLGKLCHANYTGATTWISEKVIFLLFSPFFSPILKTNSQEISRNITELLKKSSSDDLLQIFLNVIGKNIELHQEIEKNTPDYCKSFQDKYIYSLQILKEKNLLPLGFPDVSTAQLNGENLASELDKSLVEMLDTLCITLIELIEPRSIKNGYIYRLSNQEQPPSSGTITSIYKYCLNEILHFLYWLEIKNKIKDGGKYALGEYVVKQLSDPHSLNLLILYALGYEVTELEENGYGIHSTSTVLETGKKILKNYIGNEGFLNAFKIFEESSLCANKLGAQALQQRHISQQAMIHYLSIFLLEKIKHTLPPCPSKKTVPLPTFTRKKHPYFHSLTKGSETFISSLFYTITFFTQAQKQENLASWIVKNLSSKSHTDKIAKNLLSIAAHPMWRFIIIELLTTLTRYFEELNKTDLSYNFSKNDFLSTSKNCKIILSYLLKQSLPSLPKKIRTSLVFSLETVTMSLLSNLPPTSSLEPVNEILERISPGLKEYILYARITVIFRKYCLSIQYDDKFWEIWIREHLQKVVDEELLKQAELPAPKIFSTFPYNFSKWRNESQQIAEELRQNYVKTLLKMNDHHLINFLAKAGSNKGQTQTVEGSWESIKSWRKPRSDRPPILHQPMRLNERHFQLDGKYA